VTLEQLFDFLKDVNLISQVMSMSWLKIGDPPLNHSVASTAGSAAAKLNSGVQTLTLVPSGL
jgi:hypothetical protein